MLPHPVRTCHRVPPERFRLAFDVPAARRLARLGVDPASGAVLVGDGILDVRLGRWRWCTPLPNLASVDVTGPGSTGRLVGIRCGWRDGPLILGTTWSDRLRLGFHRPIAGHGPWRRGHTSALLGVERADVLADLLRPHARPR